MAERKVNVSAPKAERKVDTPFTRAFQFWRSLSGEESDTEQLSAMKSGANDTHWGPISLSQFTKDWDVYVGLFQHQLRDLVRTGSWKTGTDSLRFASIQAYIPDVPKDQHSTDTEPLYLTPLDTGELYCSKGQPFAGPYKPTNQNGLEVNYVLYSRKGFMPSDLDVVLFSPKFYQSYAFAVVPDSSHHSTNPPDTVDVKFEKWQSGMPYLQCKPTDGGGPYNISITAYKRTYWLYLAIDGSHVVVRAFLQDCPANRQLVRAEFNFQNALLQSSVPIKQTFVHTCTVRMSHPSSCTPSLKITS